MPETHGPCPICGRWRNRPVTVTGVLVEDDRLLLIKRGGEPERGKWALPGGYLDPNETTARGCEREMLEETGLTVAAGRAVGFYDDPARSPAQTVSVAYLVARVSGDVCAGDDADDAAWYALDALPPLAFDHARIVADARRLADAGG